MHEDENRSVYDEIQKQFREYEVYTEKLSNCIRQLAFAEAAVFWVLSKNGSNLTDIIVFGFFAIVLCFMFDVLQYLFGVCDYGDLAKKSEKKYKENKDIDISKIKKHPDVNKRSKLFFNLKIIMIFICSFFLIIQFFRQILCG